MKSVNTHYAKTHLSRLIDQAVKGEPFIIAKGGKPMVKVVPIEPPSDPDAPKARKDFGLGSLEGQAVVPDDMDTMFEDEIAEMFGLDG